MYPLTYSQFQALLTVFKGHCVSYRDIMELHHFSYIEVIDSQWRVSTLGLEKIILFAVDNKIIK